MKRKVKLKVVTYGGESKSITRVWEFPDFENEVRELEYNNGKEDKKVQFTYPVEEQMMDWLDDQDKSEFMYDEELAMILNYEIVAQESKGLRKRLEAISEKQETKAVFEYLSNELEIDERIKNDLEATYYRMKDTLKGLGWDKKLQILFGAMGVGYEAATKVYQDFSAIFNGEREKEKEERYEKKREKLYLQDQGKIPELEDKK